jgi:molybdopterin-containing oxidoreductase family membrane subunit
MKINYREIDGRRPSYYLLLGVLVLLTLAGLAASHYMETHGHWVTGMNNQVVWGMPHVFAVFLIVAASGALNVASIASVFGKKIYKPLSPLSGLLAIALLVGGLAVLVLDLGRPDRLVIAMTHYNFKSIFAWNIILYSGFVVIVAAYLWTLMDRRMHGHSGKAGMTAFIWRLVLTTGTGSIFGFLIARQAYDAALLAPMFVVMSFAYGFAIFILVLFAAYAWSERALGDRIVMRLKNLLGVFVAGVLYFLAVYHLTNLYAPEHQGVEHFILLDGGIYTAVFWLGTVLVGGVLPLILLYAPALRASRAAIALACLAVIAGGIAHMYVTIIGGQAYPLVLFPGKEVNSTFFDGAVGEYIPTTPEILLGISGLALAGLMVAVAVKLLRFLPESLADAAVDPHA